MSNVIYTNIPAYLASCKDLLDEIAAVNAMLAGMRIAIIKAITTSKFEEYKLDTGQTKNEVRYRSLTELEAAYEGLIKLRKLLYSDLNATRQGRVQRLVDGKNFQGWI